ncbi:endonuclease/exonuclease/phosphatase family protein [Paraburkholderia sp. DD10]|jgi:endonuclease/exonuclease/phosphatase family metal-dependent hydrolase|uniref:endonuclease/exonuclease/phosphatase family protein n=1 Tax=Paraburkholderia TaxID=1822464 RepID=UPI001FD2CBD8|nr:endonuclease/exonuclease/phosphatase family protein [Paraburkholderia terricola]
MSRREADAIALERPQARSAPAHQHASDVLRIATYNIHAAVGTDGRRSAERIGEVIAALNADIVALQEVPLGGTGSLDVLPVLSDITGLHGVPGPTLDTPQRRYGNAVLTNLPVRAVRTLDLSFGSREARGALDVDVETGGGVLRVVATHLGLSSRERRAQVDLLLDTFDTPELPVILLGDLNEWFVWGRPLRALLAHFRPAAAPRTFPSRFPAFALDRVWVHPVQRLVDVQVFRSDLARVASDHLPVIARVLR